MKLHEFHERLDKILGSGSDQNVSEIAPAAIDALDRLDWDADFLTLELAAYEQGEKWWAHDSRKSAAEYAKLAHGLENQARAAHDSAEALQASAAVPERRAKQIEEYLARRLAYVPIDADHPLQDEWVQITRREGGNDEAA